MKPETGIIVVGNVLTAITAMGFIAADVNHSWVQGMFLGGSLVSILYQVTK